MDVLIGPIIVSIVAALASFVGAGIAYVQASKARESAHMLDSRAHRISRIDAEVTELRQAYRDFMLAFGTGNLDVAAVNAEILAVSQGADPELSKACRTLAHRWTAVDATTRLGLDYLEANQGTGVVRAVGEAYHASQKRLAELREQQTVE